MFIRIESNVGIYHTKKFQNNKLWLVLNSGFLSGYIQVEDDNLNSVSLCLLLPKFARIRLAFNLKALNSAITRSLITIICHTWQCLVLTNAC